MKHTLYILFFAILSCKQMTTTESHKLAKYDHLLSKFKEISFDTLEVYSMDERNKQKYKYEGVQLDSIDAVFFPRDIADWHFRDPPGLFACFKFKIDSSKIGLIARTPSEYYPTSVKLFVYDIAKDTLREFSEIAQFIGDAGVLRDVNSWIFRDSNSDIQVFSWIHDTEDNSVENQNDTTISESNLFSLSNLSKNRTKELDSSVNKLPGHLKKFVISKASH